VGERRANGMGFVGVRGDEVVGRGFFFRVMGRSWRLNVEFFYDHQFFWCEGRVGVGRTRHAGNHHL
jgi:hypothetical protein